MDLGQWSILDAIAHGEVNQPWINGRRGGYGETVSNQHFDPNDYSGTHPYQSGNFRYYQGRYGPSSASGRYQETLTTYRDNVAKYGIPGFSPEAQDQRAWSKAADLYQGSRAWRNYPGATGDLDKDVNQFGNDPNWWSSAAAPALHHEWTSVPGGLEPNDKTRSWVSNAVNRFTGGVGGLPGEETYRPQPQYSAEDAPGLLAGTAQAVASKATGPVPDVAYTGGILGQQSSVPQTGSETASAPQAGGGQFGTGGMLGTSTPSMSDDDLLAAFANTQPGQLPNQIKDAPPPGSLIPPPMQLSMSPMGLAIARAAAARGMGGLDYWNAMRQRQLNAQGAVPNAGGF